MILVTGATGRTGSEVVKALIAKGEQVRALVRDPHRAGAIQGPGVELVVGNVEKPETWDAALQGEPRGTARDLTQWANEQGAPILSLDVPSRVDTTSGTVFEPAIKRRRP